MEEKQVLAPLEQSPCTPLTLTLLVPGPALHPQVSGGPGLMPWAVPAPPGHLICIGRWVSCNSLQTSGLLSRGLLLEPSLAPRPQCSGPLTPARLRGSLLGPAERLSCVDFG